MCRKGDLADPEDLPKVFTELAKGSRLATKVLGKTHKAEDAPDGGGAC